MKALTRFEFARIALALNLSLHAKQKNDKYRSLVRNRFVPLIFTAGGAVDRATQSVLDEWKREIGAKAFEFYQKRMSVLLVQTRTKHWTF